MARRSNGVWTCATLGATDPAVAQSCPQGTALDRQIPLASLLGLRALPSGKPLAPVRQCRRRLARTFLLVSTLVFLLLRVVAPRKSTIVSVALFNARVHV